MVVHMFFSVDTDGVGTPSEGVGKSFFFFLFIDEHAPSACVVDGRVWLLTNLIPGVKTYAVVQPPDYLITEYQYFFVS